MGANAQTTVPDFVAETVLTAAKLDISAATGVPVFATTVTRDAAFGGANKVLAEGQLAYIVASDTVQYYSGALWVSVGEASKVVKMVNVVTEAVGTGTTLIPIDDTIPQITEGDQYMTLAITPASASNILIIQVVVFGSSNGLSGVQTALFQDATANALAAAGTVIPGAGYWGSVNFTHKMTAGTTSATTFRVRVGPNSPVTFTFNGLAAARLFGAITKSSITITEYTP